MLRFNPYQVAGHGAYGRAEKEMRFKAWPQPRVWNCFGKLMSAPPRCVCCRQVRPSIVRAGDQYGTQWVYCTKPGILVICGQQLQSGGRDKRIRCSDFEVVHVKLFPVCNHPWHGMGEASFKGHGPHVPHLVLPYAASGVSFITHIDANFRCQDKQD